MSAATDKCRADATGRSRMPTYPFPTDPVKPTPDESPDDPNQSIPEDPDPAASSEEMPVAQSLVESVRLEVEALRAMLGLSKNKKPDTPS